LPYLSPKGERKDEKKKRTNKKTKEKNKASSQKRNRPNCYYFFFASQLESTKSPLSQRHLFLYYITTNSPLKRVIKCAINGGITLCAVPFQKTWTTHNKNF
jgi:hypothetical protein